MAIKTYKSTDTTKITEHFKASEFVCKCGGSHDTLISTELCEKLEDLYSKLNCSKIIVNSGYRCASHDKAVGGSGSGQHTKGTAADVICYDANGEIISSKTVCCTAQDLGFPGIANINTNYQSTHLDVRSSGTYYGDEIKGTNTVTSDFYTYFGISKATDTNTSYVRGIDVSHHQGTIDWDKVQASGKVDFVMIRAGYGKESNQIDTQFETNYTACKRLGIPCGAYWYSYATTAAEAKQEVAVCLSALSGKAFTYPIAYDIEETNSLKAADTIANAFCSALENAGYTAMIYSSKSMLDSYFSAETKAKYAIWVAQWASACSYTGTYQLWQYSNTGSVDGISGNVDLDYAMSDFSTTTTKNNSSTNTLEQILEHVASIDEKLG
ncbi:MAG: D-Ala-D-Ala carboxypeptidase family metallohydrolase [Ruminococcus sp.]|nr:D-Ala-D-Ala carboxypeptidase family metallohydrolase [Ruminococcus sp.]